MKTSFVLFSAIIFTIILSSCEKEMGKWSDEIKLTQKEFNFKAAGDSAVVVAKGQWWGINCVYLDTTLINVYGSSTDNCNVTYSDSNITIISKNCNTLLVKMNANPINSPRKLSIGLWAGDYYDGVRFIQSNK